MKKLRAIYRKVQDRGPIRARTISALLDASVYTACRELGIPKILKEITQANSFRHKSLAKYYRMLITELDIKIPIVDPIDCIEVSNKANLSGKTKRRAVDIIYHVDRNKTIVGKGPKGDMLHPIVQLYRAVDTDN